MIECTSECFYQQDGWCRLNKAGAITNFSSACPHYVPKSKGIYLPAATIEHYIKEPRRLL